MSIYNLLQLIWFFVSVLFCVTIAIIRKNNDYATIIFKMTSVLFLPIILILTFTFCIAKILFKRTTFKDFIKLYLLPFLKKLIL